MNSLPYDILLMSDEELIVQYKRSENKRYVTELYKRYTHLVLGMCIHYFKDKDQAKRMVIEICEKLVEDLRKREVENFKAWVTFAISNYCISEKRELRFQQRLTGIESK